mmetsp:Transcript_81298/g.263696  ORF Transcript_81298/g.263696 Transcript_81298/m.263696 type:complete len:361 (-) Transcript_81298:329-1411(-)
MSGLWRLCRNDVYAVLCKLTLCTSWSMQPLSHVGVVALATPEEQPCLTELELGHDRIEEDAATATDPDLFRTSLASSAILGALVPSAVVVLLLAIQAREPSEAALTPAGTPRVLNSPVLHAIVFAVPYKRDGVIDHSLLLAIVHDAGGVDVPRSRCRSRDHHRPILIKSEQQRLGPVFREFFPTDHAKRCATTSHDGHFGEGDSLLENTAKVLLGCLQIRWAFSVLGLVLKQVLRDGTGFCNVVHREFGSRSATATAASTLPRVRRARNDLLDRESAVLLIELRMSSQHSCRRNSPTTSTTSLVLNGLHRLQVLVVQILRDLADIYGARRGADEPEGSSTPTTLWLRAMAVATEPLKFFG